MYYQLNSSQKARRTWRPSKDDERTAIYLIGQDPKGPTKIGISNNPIKRLNQMQTGHPKKLWLYGIFWVKSRQIAEAVERWLLEEKYAGKRMEGEWVKVSARELSPNLDGLISITFGADVILECERHFVCYVTEQMHPELAFEDPNNPTPEEFGYEHARAELGFGA
jgi:hypothetical protein